MFSKPSVTCILLAIILSKAIPFPSLYPIEKFLELWELQVSKISPNPDKPKTVSFFQNRLFSKESLDFLSKLINLNAVETEKNLRFHLGICYDVCHAAVEFEEPKKSCTHS